MNCCHIAGEQLNRCDKRREERRNVDRRRWRDHCRRDSGLQLRRLGRQRLQLLGHAVRRDGETLTGLLKRLDTTIDLAWPGPTTSSLMTSTVPEKRLVSAMTVKMV